MQPTTNVHGQAAPDTATTPDTRLMLVDSNDYTASVLIDDLRRRGLGFIQWAATTLDVPRVMRSCDPDVVVVNYHSDQPDSLTVCRTIKQAAPLATIVVIASPGPALKAVRHWAKETSSIDVIIEKPLSDERFFSTVSELLRARAATREVDAKMALLASLVPDGALSAMENSDAGEAEIFDAAVIFTDIRGSSRLIREMAPQAFFENLNALLSAQAALVRSYQGSIVKYTGDGMLAVFRGMGRSYLAMRCGLEIAALSGKHPFPFGTGIAQGLVLAGLIGDSSQAGQKRQYDVIGATVHLAAHLCELASAGEVIATQGLNKTARVTSPAPRLLRGLKVRGLNVETDCLAFALEHSITTSGS